MLKLKKGDRVEVYGGTQVQDNESGGPYQEGDWHWNSGHTAKVVAVNLLDDHCVEVKFDGKCGKPSGCVGAGVIALAHINQCRKVKKKVLK